MTFKNLKISVVKVEGPCSRMKEGVTFYVRNACLEIPPEEKLCIFALGSLLQPISGAVVKNEPGEGILDLLAEWQCPDPAAKVVFRIEEEG